MSEGAIAPLFIKLSAISGLYIGIKKKIMIYK